MRLRVEHEVTGSNSETACKHLQLKTGDKTRVGARLDLTVFEFYEDPTPTDVLLPNKPRVKRIRPG